MKQRQRSELYLVGRAGWLLCVYTLGMDSLCNSLLNAKRISQLIHARMARFHASCSFSSGAWRRAQITSFVMRGAEMAVTLSRCAKGLTHLDPHATGSHEHP